MKQSVPYQDIDQCIEEVENAMKQEKDRRLYERYQAISLHLKGYTNKAVADILCRTNVTIGTYVKRYKESGLDGLCMSYSPGAPRRMTPEQEDSSYSYESWSESDNELDSTSSERMAQT